jgi:deferrochelatase/peroxidase EfeB
VTPVPVTTALDLADIQGNLLRGYRSGDARHFALAFGDPRGAAELLGGLVGAEETRSPQITTAQEWDDKPHYRLNVGLTWTGLEALGVPAAVLGDFPPAFAEGPAARAVAPDPDFAHGVGLGDVGDSAPAGWILGGASTPTVHAVVSLYTDEHRVKRLDEVTARLRERFAATGTTEISVHEANALPHGQVHFGYRDGIAQPEIAGARPRDRPDMQPQASPGDFLLGRDHVNAYGGNFLGRLPPALGDNGTYAAFRILRQDVLAFERLLVQWGRQWRLDPELIAAKLLGRWRNGVPLTLSPQGPQATPPISKARLNDFDYAPAPGHPTYLDDQDGRRCPIGSHIRRLNPRSSLVMGLPHSRRLIRRGMPYGPALDPDQPDDGVERGLVGLFICGDLELQYEFMLRVWANGDLATHGLRGTRDPLIGAQPDVGGQFVLRTDDSRDPIVLTGLPNLVQTRGSVYCFVPGIGGLRHLSSLTGAVT